MKRLGRGSVNEKVRNDGQVSIPKWFDNKSVVLTSYVHGKHPLDTYKRRSKNGKNYVFINRPSIVKNYNLYMGGIDFLESRYKLLQNLLSDKKVDHSSYIALYRFCKFD
ncbi:hypothetical protein NPIL_360961 [Nephila pilipes]|uniref:PiggyBac transposable element-derived protein domain-containing protein n=1 Tax=Nephila pilipes TaxID=299642 RepID=A0A8X6P198_NEPPI|nr:hypothetical protein NPIL_360961 [Nephila pilipes]